MKLIMAYKCSGFVNKPTVKKFGSVTWSAHFQDQFVIVESWKLAIQIANYLGQKGRSRNA